MQKAGFLGVHDMSHAAQSCPVIELRIQRSVDIVTTYGPLVEVVGPLMRIPVRDIRR